MKVAFQGGALATQNSKSSGYKQLDPSKIYGYLNVLVGFDTKKDAANEVVRVQGVVSLAKPEITYAPVSEAPNASFRNEIYLSNPNVSGVAYNSAGNGKRDGGRVTGVGLVSPDRAALTVSDLRQVFGRRVVVGYPN